MLPYSVIFTLGFVCLNLERFRLRIRVEASSYVFSDGALLRRLFEKPSSFHCVEVHLLEVLNRLLEGIEPDTD